MTAHLWLSINWASSSEFVSSSIPSWQISTAHAQPFRGARDLAFCRKGPLDSLLVRAISGGSGETARMCRLAWTFAARIGDKYQIRLTRSSWAISWQNQQTDMHVRSAKTQISLGVRPVWSESLLSAWRKVRFLATHKADSEDSYQTGLMPRLIWLFAGCLCHFLCFVMRWLVCVLDVSVPLVLNASTEHSVKVLSIGTVGAEQTV